LETDDVGRCPSLVEWNEALIARFFREDLAGRQVFLYVTAEVLDQVASAFSMDHTDFVSAIAGPPGSFEASQVAHRAVKICDRGHWRDSSEAIYPPYVAHLCLFAYAAASDEAEDLAGHSYYPRLRRLLGLPEDEGALSGFHELSDRVWNDLEEWSIHDMGGDLGVFRRRVFGKQRHVGVPRSQTLITEAEVESLPRAFAAGLLDPACPPSDRLLAETVEEFCDLKAKTRMILSRAASDEMRRALLDVVREELLEWNGVVSSRDGTTSDTFGSLFICIEPGAGNARGRSYLRCSIGVAYPVDGIEFEGASNEKFTCREMSWPWSTRIKVEGEVFDASILDWSAGLDIQVLDVSWRLRSRRASIRLFEDGTSRGLPGWIEVNRMQKDRALLIAYPKRIAPSVEKWADASTHAHASVILSGALPDGWAAMIVEGVADVRGLGAHISTAGFTDHVTVEFVGGMRVGRRERFFTYGVPAIALGGATGDEQIWANDVLLSADSDGLFRVGESMVESRGLIKLKVTRDSEEVAFKNLSFNESVEWASLAPTVKVDAMGKVVSTGPAISGAVVDHDLTTGATDFSPDLMLPINSAQLIGRNRGEVCDWPEDGIPAWKVIWAIGSASRGRIEKPVIFCGTDLLRDDPQDAKADTERKDLRRWDHAIYGQRKRLAKPRVPSLSALWRRYEERAR